MKTFRKHFNVAFLLFAFGPLVSFSQQDTIYTPAPLVTENLKQLDFQKKELQNQLSSLAEKKGKVKTYIENRYKGRFDYYDYSIKSGDFYFDTELNVYVNSIYEKIAKANPSIPPITIFISRYPSANAFNTGDGNIVVNIGLLNKLANDAQLAFILSHEIAHQTRSHVNNTIISKAEKYMSKEFQEQLKQTLKEEYNVRSKVRELLMPEIFNDMRFGRRDELEADSLGLIYSTNAGFNSTDIIATMDLLSQIDTYYDSNPLQLKSLITVPEVKFNDRWLNNSHATSSLSMIEEDADTLEDSLKTHPDTKLRREAMERQLKTIASVKGQTYVSDSTHFERFRLIADMEMVASYFYYEVLSRMMYQAYEIKARYPSNTYANMMLSLGYARLHYLQSEHQVQREIALPKRHFEKSYNNFLAFLNEVKMEETAALGYYGIRPVNEQWKNNEDYLFTLFYTARQFEKASEATAFKMEYLKKFPKGKYTETLNTLK